MKFYFRISLMLMFNSVNTSTLKANNACRHRLHSCILDNGASWMPLKCSNMLEG